MPASSPAASPSISAALPTRRALEFAAVRQHRPAGVQPGNAARLDGRGAVPVAGRRVLPAVRSQVRAEPADAGLRRADQDLIGADSADFNAPPDTPFYSRSDATTSSSSRVFGEATYRFNPQWALTGGLRYYDFNEDRLLTFAGLFADLGYTDQPGSTSSDGFSPRVILAFSPNEDVQFTAQVAAASGSAASTIRSTSGLCSAEDLVTYGGHPNWDDEEVDQLRDRRQDAAGRWPRDVQRRGVLDQDRRTCRSSPMRAPARRASSSMRRPRSQGAEMELFVRPNEHWDFGLSATYVEAEITESQLDASRQPDRRHPRRQSAADFARAAGGRRPRLQLDHGLDRSRATCASPCSTSVRRSRSSLTRSRTSA